MRLCKNFVTALALISFTAWAQPRIYAAESLNVSQELTKDFSAAAKKAIPAVVSIKIKVPHPKKGWGFGSDSETDGHFLDEFFQRYFGHHRDGYSKPQPMEGQGSGFLVSDQGYILTNSHVVDGATEISVRLSDGTEKIGKVIGLDTNTDIAVVKIDGKDFPYLKLGNSDDLEVGQWVAAVGNLMGLQASFTVGVVSAKGRNNLDLTGIEDFIQTDAAINRGNSGGPLLTLNGEVVGINTAIVTNMNYGGYMGIGFAIPSNIAKLVLDQILEKGKFTRGYIGVVLQNLDQRLASSFNLEKPEGALVVSVTKGSPAEKAGIKQDDIIVKYGHHFVGNIVSLRNAIALMKPNNTVDLTIIRDGKNINLPVEIEPFPDHSAALPEAKETHLGFSIENISPEAAQKMGLETSGGVVISKIEPGSVADWAGLKKGTIIIAVNKKRISDIKEFYKELKQAPKDKPLLLLIRQGDSIGYITLMVE